MTLKKIYILLVFGFVLTSVKSFADTVAFPFITSLTYENLQSDAINSYSYGISPGFGVFSDDYFAVISLPISYNNNDLTLTEGSQFYGQQLDDSTSLSLFNIFQYGKFTYFGQ